MHSHSGEMLEWLKRHAWKACIRQNRISGSNPEWLKRHAWKACIRQNRISGSNPDLSATKKRLHSEGMRLFLHLRLQARLQSRRRGKAMICSAYQPFCPSRFSLLPGLPRRAVRECAALQGEHNPDEGARRVLRLQARLQSRRCGMRRKNGNLSYYFHPTAIWLLSE